MNKVKNLSKKNQETYIHKKSEFTEYDWFWIPPAARSALTVLDPSEAAFLR